MNVDCLHSTPTPPPGAGGGAGSSFKYLANTVFYISILSTITNAYKSTTKRTQQLPPLYICNKNPFQRPLNSRKRASKSTK